MIINKHLFLIGFALLLSNCRKADEPLVLQPTNRSWRFAVLGDTHVAVNSDTVKEMIPYILQDSVDLLLLCGDLVEGGKMTSSSELEAEFGLWLDIFEPLYNNGIGIYPVRGNHEDDATNDIEVWNRIFSGTKALPQNGPAGELNLTYSFNHKNAFFVGLDHYINLHRVNQNWLDNQLQDNTNPHVFVFGHEAAFKVFHSDCLDDYPADRDAFWKSLVQAGVKSYFCGHDHFLDISQWNDGDGNAENDIYQCVAGGGGAWLMSKYNFNGSNSNYQPVKVNHSMIHGYLLVEINGSTSADLEVSVSGRLRNESESGITYKKSSFFYYKVEKN